MPDYKNLTTNEQMKAASSRGDNGHLKMLFAQGGVDVNAVFAIGYTALHCAAQNNYPEVVRTLLNNGAKINAIDWDGRTAMKLAMDFENQGVVDVMEEAGANICIGKLVVADDMENHKKIDILVEEYVQSLDFNAIKADYTAAMALVQATKQFLSPYDGGPALEMLMEGVVSQLLDPVEKPVLIDADHAPLELIGVDQVVPEFLG